MIQRLDNLTGIEGLGLVLWTDLDLTNFSENLEDLIDNWFDDSRAIIFDIDDDDTSNPNTNKIIADLKLNSDNNDPLNSNDFNDPILVNSNGVYLFYDTTYLGVDGNARLYVKNIERKKTLNLSVRDAETNGYEVPPDNIGTFVSNTPPYQPRHLADFAYGISQANQYLNWETYLPDNYDGSPVKIWTAFYTGAGTYNSTFKNVRWHVSCYAYKEDDPPNQALGTEAEIIGHAKPSELMSYSDKSDMIVGAAGRHVLHVKLYRKNAPVNNDYAGIARLNMLFIEYGITSN